VHGSGTRYSGQRHCQPAWARSLPPPWCCATRPNLEQDAQAVELAVRKVLEQGYRTADLLRAEQPGQHVSTQEMAGWSSKTLNEIIDRRQHCTPSKATGWVKGTGFSPYINPQNEWALAPEGTGVKLSTVAVEIRVRKTIYVARGQLLTTDLTPFIGTARSAWPLSAVGASSLNGPGNSADPIARPGRRRRDGQLHLLAANTDSASCFAAGTRHRHHARRGAGRDAAPRRSSSLRSRRRCRSDLDLVNRQDRLRAPPETHLGLAGARARRCICRSRPGA